jgi:TetR/AcrR family transcriptional regulator, transcriptional repressor for nem operon
MTAVSVISNRLFMYTGHVGRPKEFDRDEVLARALGLFWQRGYRGVSVRELADAMGINVATVYSEFGDKERLFAEALAVYESRNVPGFIGSLERTDANLDTIAEVLGAFADFASSGSAPGCLITNSAIEQVPDPTQSQAALLRYVERLRSAYGNALDDPSNGSNAQQQDGLAHALTATTLGLFVLIRAQAPAEIVRQIVDTTLASLGHERPKSAHPPTKENNA